GLTKVGGVECWGSNFAGALGDGTSNNSSTPVDVVGLSSGVTAVAVGDAHSCALTATGRVKCWGDNGAGQVGGGTATVRSTPVDVAGLSSGVTAIAAGGDHTCARTSGGAVKCWGSDFRGELGDGTAAFATHASPVDVAGLSSGVT